MSRLFTPPHPRAFTFRCWCARGSCTRATPPPLASLSRTLSMLTYYQCQDIFFAGESAWGCPSARGPAAAASAKSVKFRGKRPVGFSFRCHFLTVPTSSSGPTTLVLYLLHDGSTYKLPEMHGDLFSRHACPLEGADLFLWRSRKRS